MNVSHMYPICKYTGPFHKYLIAAKLAKNTAKMAFRGVLAQIPSNENVLRLGACEDITIKYRNTVGDKRFHTVGWA